VLVVNILQKSTSSADVWKRWDSWRQCHTENWHFLL